MLKTKKIPLVLLGLLLSLFLLAMNRKEKLNYQKYAEKYLDQN